MTNAQKRLERSIRITPRADRDRHVPEWSHDLAAAAEHSDEAAREVSKGARAVAWTLRRRQVERALTGGSGVAVAVVAWSVILLLGVTAFLLGGPVLVLVVLIGAGVLIVLAKAGSPTHWSHRMMLVSAAAWLVCTIYFWWAWGVAFEAEDAMRPVPNAARYDGAALLLGLIAFAGFVASVVVAVVRGRRPMPTKTGPDGTRIAPPGP
jgi:hypothetical protein